jgi:GTP-binding protein HflX
VSRPEIDTEIRPARTLIVQPAIRSALSGKRTPEAMLEEAEGLARAIDLHLVDSRICPLAKISPAYLIGKGQAEAIGEFCKENEIDLVFINHPISPPQQRNLEKTLNAKVIDRTGLILEIFGARAQTKEGQLQVELAALTYQRSRLVRSWTHLERQRGGFGFLGGPGESQLEIDRRLISGRIIKIKAELNDVRRTRGLHRTAREKAETPVIALVGYTNAGKSTLFNRLTGSEVFAKDLLFATLDPTMRLMELPTGRKVILSDTVGFISDLPTHLVESFRATLEELETAQIILHVRDCSHADTRAQKQDVEKVLESLGIKAQDPRLIEVMNKVDLLPEDEQQNISQYADRMGRETTAAWTFHEGEPQQGVKGSTVAISALNGNGIEALLKLLDEKLELGHQNHQVKLKYNEGAQLAWLYEHGNILSRRDGLRHIQLDVVLSKPDWGRYQAQFNDKN